MNKRRDRKMKDRKMGFDILGAMLTV